MIHFLSNTSATLLPVIVDDAFRLPDLVFLEELKQTAERFHMKHAVKSILETVTMLFMRTPLRFASCADSAMMARQAKRIATACVSLMKAARKEEYDFQPKGFCVMPTASAGLSPGEVSVPSQFSIESPTELLKKSAVLSDEGDDANVTYDEDTRRRMILDNMLKITHLGPEENGSDEGQA
jgi:hypothetical protein